MGSEIACNCNINIHDKLSDCNCNKKIVLLQNRVDKKKYMDISYSKYSSVIKTEGEWLHVETPGKWCEIIERKSDAKNSQKL